MAALPTTTPYSSSSSILGANPINTNTTSSVAAPVTGVTAGSTDGNLLQGKTNPLVTSTSSTVTGAPSWYTDYLNQLSTQGANAAQNAKFVGATPEQEAAWNLAKTNQGNYETTLQSAIDKANAVGDSDLYKAIGNLGEQNIRRNLAPQATAGLVGSGQFGSSRGATALGDTIANAELGITAQQQLALQQDYANKLAASQQLGNLASSKSALGLADVNALSTAGSQRQAILQNEQLFPMQQLINESSLLKNYTIPTSVSASSTAPATTGQMQNSPLANYMSLATTAATLGKDSGLSKYLFGTASTKDAAGNIIKGTAGALTTLLDKANAWKNNWIDKDLVKNDFDPNQTFTSDANGNILDEQGRQIMSGESGYKVENGTIVDPQGNYIDTGEFFAEDR